MAVTDSRDLTGAFSGSHPGCKRDRQETLRAEVLSMIQKCTNPDCDEPFEYFRCGRIYQIDWREKSRVHATQNHPAAVEYFWLCGLCCLNLRVTVRQDGHTGVSVGLYKRPNLILNPHGMARSACFVEVSNG